MRHDQVRGVSVKCQATDVVGRKSVLVDHLGGDRIDDCQATAKGIGDHQRSWPGEPQQVSAGHRQLHLAGFRGGRDREIQQQQAG